CDRRQDDVPTRLVGGFHRTERFVDERLVGIGALTELRQRAGSGWLGRAAVPVLVRIVLTATAGRCDKRQHQSDSDDPELPHTFPPLVDGVRHPGSAHLVDTYPLSHLFGLISLVSSLWSHLFDLIRPGRRGGRPSAFPSLPAVSVLAAPARPLG